MSRTKQVSFGFDIRKLEILSQYMYNWLIPVFWPPHLIQLHVVKKKKTTTKPRPISRKKQDPCILGISFQRKSLGFKTLPIGIVNATWSKYSAKELLWRPTKAKRYFIAHQLFKWSIEVTKNISLISASIDSRKYNKILVSVKCKRVEWEALPYEKPHLVRQPAIEHRNSPKQWSSHFSSDFLFLFTENFQVKKDKINALITSLLSFLCLPASNEASRAGIDTLEQTTL